MPTFQTSGLKGLISDVGRAAVHSLYPNDVEYYFMAFELVDSQGSTIDYLSLPVMPQSLNRSKTEITNIKKTFGGVTALSSQGFIPISFRISGMFGRNLRILINNKDLTFAALRYSFKNGVFKKGQITGDAPKALIFNPVIKTGYGVTKLLEGIFEKSNMLDNNNKPFRLYFYNPAFGESYMIKGASLNFEQNEGGENMLWKYDINFTAIAPLDQIESETKRNLAADLQIDNLAKGINLLAEELRRSL